MESVIFTWKKVELQIILKHICSKLETFKLSKLMATLQSIMKIAGGQMKNEIKEMKAEIKEKKRRDREKFIIHLEWVC